MDPVSAMAAASAAFGAIKKGMQVDLLKNVTILLPRFQRGTETTAIKTT